MQAQGVIADQNRHHVREQRDDNAGRNQCGPACSQGVDQRGPGAQAGEPEECREPERLQEPQRGVRDPAKPRVHRPQVPAGEAAEQHTHRCAETKFEASKCDGRETDEPAEGDDRRQQHQIGRRRGVFRKSDLVGDTRDIHAGAGDRQHVAALDNGLARERQLASATAQSEEVDATGSHLFTEGAQRRPGELAVGQHEIGRDARDVDQLGVVDLVAQHPGALDDCPPATPDRNQIVSLEGRGWRHIDERGPAAKPLDRHPI